MSDSRYSVLVQPIAAPGHCYISGETGSEHGPYIDTGVNVRQASTKGAVYLSRNTIVEMYNELKKFEGLDPDLKYTEEDQQRAINAAYDRGFNEGVSDVKEKFNEFVDALNADDLAGVYALVGPSSSEFEAVSEDTGVAVTGDASVHAPSGEDDASPKRKKRGSVSGDSVHEPDGDNGLGLSL